MANTTGKKFGGRKKGTPNKLTTDIREAYKQILVNNLSNIDRWLNETAKKSPDKALQLMIRISEFVVPKLQNTTLTSEFDRMSDEQVELLINKILENEKAEI